jgi:hypothetical protein
MRARLRGRRPTPAFVIACIALFVAMSGVAYASVSNNSVRSRHIVNDAVTSADIKGGGGRTGDVKNRDVNKSLAVAKGFATVNSQNNNGSAQILNAGGQQTANLPGGVTAERQAPGLYLVTFNANTGTGKFAGINSLDDLAIQATAKDFGDATVTTAGSTASENQVRLRVRILNGPGNAFIDRDFSVQFYANE